MLLHDFCAHKQLKFINFRAFFNHLKNGLGTLLCLLYLTCGGLYSPVASAEERSVVDQTASMQGLLLELKAQIADLKLQCISFNSGACFYQRIATRPAYF